MDFNFDSFFGSGVAAFLGVGRGDGAGVGDGDGVGSAVGLGLATRRVSAGATLLR